MFVYDQADLSARLRELHKWAGSPSAHTMEASAGDFGVLPHSTAHRIIKGQTIPRHLQQMKGFLRACGLPGKHWEPWTAAWTKASDVQLVYTVRDEMHFIIEMLVKQALDKEKGLAA